MKRLFVILLAMVLYLSMSFALPAAEAAIEYQKSGDEIGTIIASGNKLKVDKKNPFDDVMLTKFFNSNKYRMFFILQRAKLYTDPVNYAVTVIMDNRQQDLIDKHSITPQSLNLLGFSSLYVGAVADVPDNVIKAIKDGQKIRFRFTYTANGAYFEWEVPEKVLQEWKEVTNVNANGVNALNGKPIKIAADNYMSFYRACWQDEKERPAIEAAAKIEKEKKATREAEEKLKKEKIKQAFVKSEMLGGLKIIFVGPTTYKSKSSYNGTVLGVGLALENTTDSVIVINWSESVISYGILTTMPFIDGMKYRDAGNPSATPDTILPPKTAIGRLIYFSNVSFDSRWSVTGTYMTKQMDDPDNRIKLTIKVTSNNQSKYYNIESNNLYVAHTSKF